METFIAKYKIKDNKINDILDWGKTLNSRSSEVVETLISEGVQIESAFLDEQVDGLYVFYYMRCKNIKEVFKLFSGSNKSIDMYHKRVLSQCLGEPKYLKILIDFSTFNN